jgi:hypothetical protein
MCFEINRVQLVHRGMQRELCSGEIGNRWQAAPNAEFREFTRFSRVLRASNIEIPIVKILRESALGAGMELLMRAAGMPTLRKPRSVGQPFSWLCMRYANLGRAPD